MNKLFIKIIPIPFMLILIILIPWAALWIRLKLNIAALHMIRFEDSRTETIEGMDRLLELVDEDCHALWLYSMSSRRIDSNNIQELDWRSIFLCSPKYIYFAKAIAPKQMELATLATKVQPGSKDGWLWLADLNNEKDFKIAAFAYLKVVLLMPENEHAWVNLGWSLAELGIINGLQLYDDLGIKYLNQSDPLYQSEALFILGQIYSKENDKRAIEFYRQGLQIAPKNSWRWRELGDFLHVDEPEAALEAYIRSCEIDTGIIDGCHRAGDMAEKLGYITLAIRYYRKSWWKASQERADFLELQLSSNKP